MHSRMMIIGISLCAAVFLAAGCAVDDDTLLAQLEDAQIAMDHQDYDKAVGILEEVLDQDGDGDFDETDVDALSVEDAETALDLASAYMGRGGVDVIAFLDAAADLTAPPSLWPDWGTLFAVFQKTLDFGVAPAHATEACELNDANFQVVADVLPPVTVEHLADIQAGLVILEQIIALNDPDLVSLQDNAELMQAVGFFTQVVMEILLATDTDGDNVPDSLAGVDQGLADLIEEVLDFALSAILDSGLLGEIGLEEVDFDQNDLSQAINDLKETIRNQVPGDGETITAADLTDFITDIVPDECITA